MEKTEDHTAPVCQADIAQAIRDTDQSNLVALVDRVLGAINEKRDSYNGVVSSMIYFIGSKNTIAITRLSNGLIEYLTQRPMSFAGKTFLTKALYRLIQDEPCFVQDLFECLIESSGSWEGKMSHDKSYILKIKIIALKAIKQSEQSKFGRPSTLSSEFIDRLCMESITKGDDATKIDTLSLVLESRSTTRILDDRELSIYQTIFVDAICLQDPALRQIFIALTNKLLKRLKDSYRVVIRDNKRFSDSDRELIRCRYFEFIEWLIQTCLDSNYCNAYFGSFVLTISTLKLIILHVTYEEEGLPIVPLLSSRRCYDSILSCLGDSFEENKILALSLLLSLPYNEVFFSDTNINTFESIAYDLIDSINPAHSLTCQYVFKLLIGLEERRAKRCGSTLITKNRLLLKHLSNLIGQVEKSIESVEDSFTLALTGKPVYPKLTCIRSLLEEALISELEEDRHQWLELCHRVVIVSIEACRAVSSIVCNLNPETIGHLPMDLMPVDPESLAKSFNLSISATHSEYSTISSQMLLISGWKTIKECSLSLGTLCVRFWWPKDGIRVKKEKFPGLIGSEPMLARDDILKILNYFEHYLRNLRHRGAFEQAYNGFIMVTRRIWHDQMFRQLLVKTLKEIMTDFKTDNVSIDCDKAEYLKAYVTRRSAGLPFIVQAILISEHKQESEILDLIMSDLFAVLTEDKSEEYQRIHCMNILRALIKEHNLGEKVLKHVGKTLSITLRAFRSDSFPIRNCANMLLKAVVDRTFGVNRLKDEIHRRNQLSFEKFFSEFPDLFDEMLEYLNTDVTDKRYLPSIHSVLIVLSRLKASTSPSSSYTFDKIIEPFIRPTMKWALNSPDYKLREVAARICTQLCNYSSVQSVPPVNTVELKDYISKELSFQKGNSNQTHGRLIATKFLIDSASDLFYQLKDSIWSNLKVADRVLFAAPSISSLKLNFIETLESWSRVSLPEVIPIHQFTFCISLEEHVRDLASDKHPHSEQALFKLISFMMIENFSSSSCGSFDKARDINSIIAGGIFHQCSLNLQAALIRLLRQLHHCDSDDIVDELHSVLDLDSTAVHETPFDRLKYRKEEALECAKLEAYLSRCNMSMANSKRSNYRYLIEPFLNELSRFSSFEEFQPLERSAENQRFSVKSSNTPRSIELLAYACKTRAFRDLEGSLFFQDPGETIGDKLRFMSAYISSLHDSDVKSLAIVLAGQLAQQVDLDNRENVAELDLLSSIINDLADNDHSFVIRKACCHFLKITFRPLVESRSKINTTSLVNFMSAIIKLTKDSESELRLLTLKIVSSLDELVSPKYGTLSLSGSRLDPLIRLMVDGTVFNHDDVEHLNQLLELSCQIIFDHRKDIADACDQDEERLFDKTKLNTFADHIAATRSALQGLYLFFERSKQSDRSVDLDLLKFPSVVLTELHRGLKLSTSSPNKSVGDYSWRLRQSEPPRNSLYSEHAPGRGRVIERLLQEILASFEYFTKGYRNILTDTQYIDHELSLYRRLAFVKFVLDCVHHEQESVDMLNMTRGKLQEIIRDSCATTILTKCIGLIQ